MVPTTAITVDDASRLGPLLGFQASVDARYEAETAPYRVREIRRAIVVGLVFFNLYALAAIVVLPDVFWLALALHWLVMTPVALGIAWAVGRLTPSWRERAVLAGSVGAAAVPVVLLWASQAAEAAYSAGDLTLSMLFSTMMLVLRFRHAVIFVGAALAMAVPCYYLKDSNSVDLAHALALQLVCAGGYLLFGNYRLQRSVRHAYLRATRESLRTADLEVDNTALEQLSLVDPLTGIANRRRLTERLKAWRADGASAERPLAVVMVDVDHFKRYNDGYGHPAGDLCLQRIAHAMAACLRDDRDLIARYGGEEFAVLLPDAEAAEATAVAQRLCKAVSAIGLPHAHRGDGCTVVTVSAGVASTTAGGLRRTRGLFEAADAALYRAKQQGRNQHATNEPAARPAEATASDFVPLSSAEVKEAREAVFDAW